MGALELTIRHRWTVLSVVWQQWSSGELLVINNRLPKSREREVLQQTVDGLTLAQPPPSQQAEERHGEET